MALVSFLSGGYNLHRFSDAIGLVYSVSRVKVLNKIYWQKGPVTFKLCTSLENSTGHGPGGQHYYRTLHSLNVLPLLYAW